MAALNKADLDFLASLPASTAEPTAGTREQRRRAEDLPWGLLRQGRRTDLGDFVVAQQADLERLTAERAALLAPVEDSEGIVDLNEVLRLGNAYRALAGIPPAERTAGERADLVNVAESLALDAPALAREVARLRADVQRLQEERAKLEALAAELFDGVPTSPENALTWLHQEMMRALTTPNWPGVLVEILMERVRQIEKGYDAAHDDKLTAFELSTVAAAVTLGTVEHLPVSGDARELTGHIIEKWDIRRRLVIAAALLVAEVERLDRAAARNTADSC